MPTSIPVSTSFQYAILIALATTAGAPSRVRTQFNTLVKTLKAERVRLMTRVNVAYAANDLLSLLELQLEIDQIDQTGLDNLGDDRIKQYNRILEGQINQVGSEMVALESAFAFDMGWQFGWRRRPKAMMKGLRADIAEMQADIKRIETDLDAFADIKRFKAWLKGCRMANDDSM